MNLAETANLDPAFLHDRIFRTPSTVAKDTWVVVDRVGTDFKSVKNVRSQINPRLDGWDETTLVYKNVFPQQEGSWQKGVWDTSNNDEPASDVISHGKNTSSRTQEINIIEKKEDNIDMDTPRNNNKKQQL